ncbi:hypothetical protein FE784_25240 [Paenibacillus hemerocallicola]|uniref:Uncharacterized protein n=1 Tax=Paenibacillus hemerocallicola TaxID=1172614 RepID=A0A5C4T335_9BACL|nr:hypothetical protein FE784_25240 [Paenibacillus hemerocallicola]
MMPEGKGIGFHSPADNGFRRFLSDDRMLSADGVAFDQKGSILFNNNRLHQMFDEDGSDIDWNNPYYLIIWEAYVGPDVKSYLYARCRRTRSCSPASWAKPYEQ